MKIFSQLTATSPTRRFFFSTAFAIAGIVTLSIMAQPANAIPVSGFNAGRIVDDSVFTNYTSMNASQIQDFLNSKVSTCDTWGTQPSEYGGGTRAGYDP